LNSPDVQTSRDITEAEVRVAGQEAGLSGLTHVHRQTHSVFVAVFYTRYDAVQARQNARLHFVVPSETSAPAAHLSVRAEFHQQEVNRLFAFETNSRSINHAAVYRRVFEALESPLASSFQLLQQLLKPRRESTDGRVRYILRPTKAVCPIFVERFYFPLDAADGESIVWGIFKPVHRHWKCPACHKKCQSGDSSTCENAALLVNVNVLKT
jgi:hypothetical protein